MLCQCRQRLHPLAASIHGRGHQEVVPHTQHVQCAVPLWRASLTMPLFFDEEIGARDCGEDVKWSDLTPSAAASSEDGEMDDTSGGVLDTCGRALGAGEEITMLGCFFIKIYPSQQVHERIWTSGALLNKFREVDFEFAGSCT